MLKCRRSMQKLRRVSDRIDWPLENPDSWRVQDRIKINAQLIQPWWQVIRGVCFTTSMIHCLYRRTTSRYRCSIFNTMSQRKKFNPWQAYLMIGGGSLLVITQFLTYEAGLTMIETLKMGLGIIMIGYGVFRLRKKI